MMDSPTPVPPEDDLKSEDGEEGEEDNTEEEDGEEDDEDYDEEEDEKESNEDNTEEDEEEGDEENVEDEDREDEEVGNTRRGTITTIATSLAARLHMDQAPAVRRCRSESAPLLTR